MVDWVAMVFSSRCKSRSIYFLMQVMVSEGAELVADVNGIATSVIGSNPSLISAINQINEWLAQIPLEKPPQIDEADIIFYLFQEVSSQTSANNEGNALVY